MRETEIGSLFALMSSSFLEVMATRYRDAAGDSGGYVQPAVDDTCLFGESRLVHSSLVLRRTVGAGRGWFAIHDLEVGLLKRAQATEQTFGNADYHRDRFATLQGY